MSSTAPPVFFDADTVLSFACAREALHALLDKLGDRAHVSETVIDELRQRVQKQPPHPNARGALSAALNMRRVRIDDDVDLDRLAELRERLARPGDSQRSHLGEASCVVLAETRAGIVASDDAGARTLARDVGVPHVTQALKTVGAVQVRTLWPSRRQLPHV